MQKNTFYSKKQNYLLQKNNKLKYQIISSDSGQRLDKWIKRKFPGTPQSLIEKYSRKGLIKLNGKKTKLSSRILTDDIILLPKINIEKNKKKITLSNKLQNLKKEILRNILYKDSEKIIVNKPPGISVHKGTKTLESIDDIKSFLNFSFSEEPRIIHRIDKDTSGILLLARTYQSSVVLSKKLKEKKIKKFYIAIVDGIPNKKEGILKNKIVNKKEQSALTKFYILKKIKQKFCFLLLQPVTGRKRQLREHCSNMNCPIIGDKKYNKNYYQSSVKIINNLFLHSYKVIISLENKNKEEFAAPLPKHFKEFCKFYKVNCNENFINNFISRI